MIGRQLETSEVTGAELSRALKQIGATAEAAFFERVQRVDHSGVEACADHLHGQSLGAVGPSGDSGTYRTRQSPPSGTPHDRVENDQHNGAVHWLHYGAPTVEKNKPMTCPAPDR